MNLVVVLSGLLYLTLFAESCPEAVAILCKCKDLYNGVQLDCSHSNGSKVIQVLRENQALLGLVQTLTMHNASLHHIPPRFLDGLYIKRLDFSYNQMVEIDDKAFIGVSPIVQDLVLSHNLLTKIPSVALTALNTILRLDLSNNSISDISSADIFPSLPKLYDINLGSNNICSIHSATFENLKNSIQIINLGHNCLRSVPSSSIRGLKQLQALHMQKNNIEVLEALSFLNLPVLSLLNLAGNKISEINRQAFLNVPQMRYLYLTNNHISRLTTHQFASFDQIEMVDLTGNNITDVPEECMARLPQLRYLFLGGNHIHSIGKNAFANSSIVTMSLINNDLTEINEDMLDGMQKLQNVVFKGNKIRLVRHNAFYNTPSLVTIDLSENEIVDLSPSTFLAQLNLQMIDLRNNKLSRTPYAALNRRVGTVFLQENPLVCTEKIHMLQDGLGVFVATSEDLICGGRPTSTTTSTSPPVMMPKLVPKRPSAFDTRPSGAFQAVGPLLQEREIPSEEKSVSNGISQKKRNPPSSAKSTVRLRGPFESDITHIQHSTHSDDVIPRELGGTLVRAFPSREHSQAASETNHVDSIPHESSHTDIANDMDTIHPFPMQFLDGSQAQRQTSKWTMSTEASSTVILEQYTLPPTVMIVSNASNPVIFQQVPLRSQTLARKEKKTPVKATECLSAQLVKDPDEEYGSMSENHKYQMTERRISPTIVSVMCMAVLAMAMVAVVIGLCILQRRKESDCCKNWCSAA